MTVPSEVANIGELGEIGIDVVARLVSRYLEPVGQPKRLHPVEQPEVDHLGGRRISGMTFSVAARRRAAVAVCMSESDSKASTSPGSPDMCAKTRNSICE